MIRNLKIEVEISVAMTIFVGKTETDEIVRIIVCLIWVGALEVEEVFGVIFLEKK